MKIIRRIRVYLLAAVLCVTQLIAGGAYAADAAETAAPAATDSGAEGAGYADGQNAAQQEGTAQTEAVENAVRVGFFPLNGFFEYDESGNMSGYGVDYFNSVAGYMDVEYEYVYADSWVKALQMLRDGELDILAPSQITAEREAEFDFCAFPIGTEYGSLLTLSTNNDLVYEDYAGFDGIKVGCVESIIFMDSYLEYEKTHGFDTELVYYRDTPALVAALNAGEVDAILANLMIKTNTMKLLGKFGAAPFYFMVQDGNHALLEKLTDAVQTFNALNPDYQNKLSQKYFKDFVRTPFTRDEMDFIAKCDTVAVGLTSGFAPVAHADRDGNACGIDVRVLNYISQISGLKFSFVMLPEDDVPYEYLVQNHVAMVADVENNFVNAGLPGLTLSNVYMSMSKVFVGLSGQYYDMNGALRVAVASASGSLDAVLAAQYPNYTVTYYQTMDECLNAVLAGEQDVVLQNRYVVEPYLSNPHYAGLTVLPEEGLPADYSYALINRAAAADMTAEEADRLLSIINKSLAYMSDTTLGEIISSEVIESGYEYTFEDFVYEYRMPLIALTLTVLTIIMLLCYAIRVQQRSRRRVQDSESKLANITNNINGGVVVLRAEEGLEITFANDGFLELIGCTRDEFINKYHNSYRACVYEEDLPLVQKLIVMPEQVIPERVSLELRILRTDGSYVKTLFNGTMEERPDHTREIYCVIMDITEQARLVDELNLEKRRADMIFEKSENIIYEINLQQKQITTSHKLREKLGWSFPEQFDRLDENTLMAMWHASDEDCEMLEKHTRATIQDRVDTSCTIQLFRSMGEPVWCQINQYPIYDSNGSVISVVGNILDVNNEMVERRRLEELAQRDSMTGLLKKEYFAKMSIAYLNNSKGKSDAIIFMDLDHFKEVNDTLGHAAGDAAIRDAAEKLQIIFSNYDILSRYGGDEFCVLVKNIPHDTLIRKLEWMVEKMKETYTGENGRTVSVTCSIGVVSTEKYGVQFEQLMRLADKALYQAKQNGRAQYFFE